ncbi:thiol-disulfide isomerase [[Brevibacterium] flavum]|uniref:Thiol-disulfide isomerase n=1 Tax=[Brevibacterium] flavum TaxID=92706 RepID=A0A0F6WQ80_9CORY|nr:MULTISPECIES: TlpA disulfide reductase family protein [Corynebacterium]AJE66930.1 thiol-disulfide isomerase [Corynebacterium glutamicum]AKF26936.1 thiol-disulfide isomerase [[Brevibacterium] flavum]ANE07756.1 thiol-disulfide isomerase [Corynebacterium glutamicum]AST20171.1 TlpA family protein disulfide reductase [Corynebacterium glutamicum ATCC 14067]KEI22646.1 thiol-disulfide isomerase [Corynebacterium glutamicum ATCC 14067]
MSSLDNAPLLELDIQEWVNHEGLSNEDLRGKVVVVEVFQMLCPGCVNHGVPQAQKIHRMIDESQVQVIGLHSVFEHHDVMTPEALKVFIDEFGIKFPVAVDMPREGQRIPSTMKKYRLEGTPSIILADRKGRIRQVQFGQVDDFVLGLLLGSLLSETDET